MKKLLTEWRKFLKEGFKVDDLTKNLTRAFMNQPSHGIALLDSLNNPELEEGIGVHLRKVANLLVDYHKMLVEREHDPTGLARTYLTTRQIRSDINDQLNEFEIFGLEDEVVQLDRTLDEVEVTWNKDTEHDKMVNQRFKDLVAGLE